jgi:hypothetical protein
MVISIHGTVKLNLLEADKANLQSFRMTKHSSFRYFKASPHPSPGHYGPLKAQKGLGVGLGWL